MAAQPTVRRHRARAVSVSRIWSGAGRKRRCSASLAVSALHVLDDNFLQPQPGTSAGDHLVSGLVPCAVLRLSPRSIRVSAPACALQS